jgi:hypothetical protein
MLLWKIDNWRGFEEDSQTDIKNSLQIGPLTAVMGMGDEYGGYFDNSGIYRCTDTSSVNHAVVIVGYNDTGQYWIVRNSWGPSWNGNGYFNVGYGECSIESYVFNASVAGVPPTITSISPTKGSTAGGTSVTITGTAFTGTTVVNFGTTAATSFTFNSATLITATSPADSAGTVDITVTTAGGTSATSTTDQYTYITAPTGSTTVGVYRATTGAFYLKNSNAAGNADMSFIYGNPSTDKPLVGDWTGQGKNTVGVYRATTGAFYLKNTNAAGNADMSFIYGDPKTDIPLVGDWTGQTNSTTGAPIDTVGIYRKTTGAFYLKNSNAAGNADMSFVYGNPSTDTPLVGDWI